VSTPAYTVILFC